MLKSKVRLLGKPQLAASIVEFLIALPVVLLAVFAAIHFALFLATRAIVLAGLQKGLAYAAANEDIESDDDRDSDPKTKVNLSARQSSIKVARDLMGSTLLGPNSFAQIMEASGQPGVRLILPDDEVDSEWHPNVILPRPSRRSALRAFPMSMAAKVRFQSPFFRYFPAVEYQIRASGYREPRFDSSIPEAINCLGQQVSLGDQPTVQQCICFKIGVVTVPTCDSATQVFNAAKCTCECRPPFVWIPSQGICGCRDDSSDNTGSGDTINNNASCTSRGGYFDTGTCTCQCINGGSWQNDGTGRNVCSCPACPSGRRAGPGCSCLCAVSPICGPGQVLSADGCSCGCGAGRSGPGCNCTTSASQCNGQPVDSGSCSCNCSAANCGAGKSPDPSNCACTCTNTCSAQQTRNESTCACSCSAGSTQADCNVAGGMTFDPVNCSCRCQKSCRNGFHAGVNRHGKCTCIVNRQGG